MSLHGCVCVCLLCVCVYCVCVRVLQEGLNKFDKEQEQQVLNVRNRLEDIQSENRTLKSELTDSQTNLALVRSELISFRQQFQEKCRELDL